MTYKRTKQEVESALAEHDYLGIVGGFSMQHTMVSMYSSSTVVRPPDSVIRGRWFADGDEFVGEQMLLNYRTDNNRLGFQLGIGRFFEQDAVLSSVHADLEEDLDKAIELPKPKKLKTALTTAITARRSGREFSGQAVSVQDLATILHHAQGTSGALPYGGGGSHGSISLRNAPSGGGLYPISLFVQAFNVDGLSAGAYEYLAHSHTLQPCTPPAGGSPDPAKTFASVDFDVNDSAFVLTFVYNMYHNSRKYGDAGVVFGLIEVGAILQNVHLSRTALALAGTDQGGYDKQAIEQALRLDGHTRHVVHVSVVGQED
ncbi:SagB/ThcOx family dehydrogenase [Stackebrandtia soli]|uniref:SagB/ThcOx family dehydrogenase n=1 Tax=Stackebrandtia soli TaxID=1892856 RepID=UPI0039E8B69E